MIGSCVLNNIVLMSGQTDQRIYPDETSRLNDDSSEYDAVYEVTSYRWIIVVLYAFCFFGNCCFGVIYAIADVSCKFYRIELEQLTWSSNGIFFISLVSFIPGTLIASRLGLRAVMILASGLNAISCCISFASVNRDGFPLFVLGVVISTFGFCLIASLPAQISAVWFDSKNQVLATNLGQNLGFCTGNSAGFIMPAIIFRNSHRNQDMEFVRRSLLWIIGSQVVFSILLFLLVMLLFKEKPSTPPSLAEAKRQNSKQCDDKISFREFCAALPGLLMNCNYQLAVIAMALTYYTFYVVQLETNQLLSMNFPGKESVVGWFGFTALWVSLIGSTVLGAYVDKTKKWKLCSVLFAALSALLWMGFTESLKRLNMLAVAFATNMSSTFFNAPLTAVLTDVIVEMAYPMSPNLVVVYSLIVQQIYGIALVFISGWLFQTKQVYACLWVMGGALAVATVLLAGMEVKTNRLTADEGNFVPAEVSSQGTEGV